MAHHAERRPRLLCFTSVPNLITSDDWLESIHSLDILINYEHSPSTPTYSFEGEGEKGRGQKNIVESEPRLANPFFIGMRREEQHQEIQKIRRDWILGASDRANELGGYLTPDEPYPNLNKVLSMWEQIKSAIRMNLPVTLFDLFNSYFSCFGKEIILDGQNITINPKIPSNPGFDKYVFQDLLHYTIDNPFSFFEALDSNLSKPERDSSETLPFNILPPHPDAVKRCQAHNDHLRALEEKERQKALEEAEADLPDFDSQAFDGREVAPANALPKSYYLQMKEFTSLSVVNKWVCLIEILFPSYALRKEQFSSVQPADEQEKLLNDYLDKIDYWRNDSSFNEVHIKKYVSQVRKSLQRLQERSSDCYLNHVLVSFPNDHPTCYQARKDIAPGNKDELSRYWNTIVAPKALLYSLYCDPPEWLKETHNDQQRLKSEDSKETFESKFGNLQLTDSTGAFLKTLVNHYGNPTPSEAIYGAIWPSGLTEKGQGPQSENIRTVKRQLILSNPCLKPHIKSVMGYAGSYQLLNLNDNDLGVLRRVTRPQSSEINYF